MSRISFALLLTITLFATACGAQAEISNPAEFDVEPLVEAAATPALEEDSSNGATTPAPVAAQTQDDQTQDDQAQREQSAGTPSAGPTIEAAADEDASADSAESDRGESDRSESEGAESDRADEPAATQVEPSLDHDELVADASRRGLVIPVRAPDGTQVERVDGDLAPGEALQYSFDVAAGQSVLIRQLGGCVFNDGNLLLADLDGPRGVSGGVFFNLTNSDCTTSSRYDAGAAGQATLTMSDIDPNFSGTFSFEVIDVTNEPTVELALGDQVSPDSPVAGAGVFEFPGSVDVYQFDVTEGAAYLVRQLGCELVGTTAARFDFEGVGGGTSFLNADNCDDVKRFEADESGTVLMYASAGAQHEGSGTYSFELVDLAATDTFDLQVGDVVSPGMPADGAGYIEEPGRRDLYNLAVVAGQTIVISQQGGCEFSGGSGFGMNIKGAGVDTNLFFTGIDDDGDGDCFDVQRFTAEFDDTIIMLARDSSNTLTGTYMFEVGSGAETIEEAEEVLADLDATQIDDERVITLDETVLFDFGSAELKANANQALAEVADVLGVYGDGDVRIVGHTDAVGTNADNEQLSQRRAEAVSDALEALGVDGGRVTATGVGESSPIEPNENDDGSDNPQGRAANRRVEIFFTAQG